MSYELCDDQENGRGKRSRRESIAVCQRLYPSLQGMLYCHVCGYDGEIMINDNMEWECPQCHNKDHAKMNVTRRTCGYLGENFWNAGKTKEIKARVLHL